MNEYAISGCARLDWRVIEKLNKRGCTRLAMCPVEFRKKEGLLNEAASLHSYLGALPKPGFSALLPEWMLRSGWRRPRPIRR